ncbi:hypothetical protein BDV93DRAFT_507383 [Ceratobasidium sp. AG-I]|nr:hypothetical protein BDV93DRAFT_507383 [Ceratobasidium sp. AG-I]
MAPNAYFTKTETEWLHSTIPYYLLTKDRGPDRAAIGRRILDRFYEQFPNRHPRYFDFSEVDEDEKGKVVYGDEWKHMPERLRNWVNANKAKAPQVSKKARENPYIVVYPSQEELAEEINNEGYYSVDPGNPYALTDSELYQQLELTISQLDAYGSSDFGSMHEAERDSATKSLNQDIYDVVQLLSAKTGGAFYIFGAWHNHTERYSFGHIFSASSDNMRTLIEQESAAIETFEQMAVNHIEQYIGRTVCTAVDHVPPTVCSGVEGLCKPVMPPPRETWQIDNRMLKLWMDATYEFQGGLLPIPWQEIEDDCREGKWERVERSRMPNGIDVLRSPDYMDEQESNAWCEHVRKDWRNLDIASHAFQFRLLGPDKIDTDLQLNTHPDSKLRYGPEARLYIAHLLRKCNKPEKQSPFPELSDSPFLVFSNEEFDEILDDLKNDPIMLNLSKLLQSYESLGPMTNERWTELRTVCPHLPDSPPVDANQTRLLGGLWLSPSYFDISDFTVARSWSFATLFDLVNDGGFVDPNTGTLLGGPLGVIWLFLIVLKGRWTEVQLAQDAFPEGVSRHSGPYEISAMEHAALNVLYDWLEKNVNHSMQLLQAARDEAAGAPGMLEPVTFNRASSPAANAVSESPKSRNRAEVVIPVPPKGGKAAKVTRGVASGLPDEQPAAGPSQEASVGPDEGASAEPPGRRSLRLRGVKLTEAPRDVESPAEEGPGEDEASASKAEWVDVEGGSADDDEGAPAHGNRGPNKGKGRQGAPKRTVQSAQRSPPKAATVPLVSGLYQGILESAESYDNALGEVPSYPPVSYIAALAEHIAGKTSHEILFSTFKRHSILREVATLFSTSSLAKVLPQFSDDQAAVILKASELWHDHKENAFDPTVRWKGLPTPEQPQCFDPFAGDAGTAFLQTSQPVPWLSRIVMLTGHNELALPVQFKKADWSEMGTPFLPKDPPSDETYRMFLTHAMLPPKFFSLVEPQRLAWTLVHFHDWILGSFFWHEVSGTYSGGFYGVRWITIAIIHLYRILSQLDNKSQALRVEAPIDPVSELRHLEACASTLASRLESSISCLLTSLDERITYGVRKGGVSAALDQSLPSASLEFDRSKHSFTAHRYIVSEDDDAHWRRMYEKYQGANMNTATFASTGDSIASLSTLISAALHGDRRDYSMTRQTVEWTPHTVRSSVDAMSTPHPARKTHPRTSDPISPPHKRHWSHSPSPKAQQALGFQAPGNDPGPRSAPPSVFPPLLELGRDQLEGLSASPGFTEPRRGNPWGNQSGFFGQTNTTEASSNLQLTYPPSSTRSDPEPINPQSAADELPGIPPPVATIDSTGATDAPNAPTDAADPNPPAPDALRLEPRVEQSRMLQFMQESMSNSTSDLPGRSTSAAPPGGSHRTASWSEQGRANESTYFNAFKRVGGSGSGVSTRNASPAARSVTSGPSNPSPSLATENLPGVAPGAATAVGSQSDASQGPSQTPAAGVRGRRRRKNP